jgi:PAS domain-containing protein
LQRRITCPIGGRRFSWPGFGGAALPGLVAGPDSPAQGRRKRDATAGKLVESEARYRMLAENSHDVIWTLDIPSRRYTYVSPSVTDMCGYLPEEVVGSRWRRH